MYLTASFTNLGEPATGLSPTIRIRKMDGTLVVTDGAMTEIGDGSYYYDFTTFDYDIDYVYRCDGGNTLNGSERYIYGRTDKIDKLFAFEGENNVYAHTFDSGNRHTGFIQYVYDSAANAKTYPSATGLLHTYQMVITYDVDGNPTKMEYTKKT